MFGFHHFKGRFSQGNRLTLMQNGEEFFPQLLRRIRGAEHEIFLETFILEKDRVGEDIKKALLRAAERGVWIGLTADSWGSHFLDKDYIEELTDAGIVFQIYDPQPQWYNGRPKLFRRLHRKLAIIDGRYGFIGGINLCHDHLISVGPQGKTDYAVEIEGPVVPEMRELCKSYVRDSSDKNLQQSIKYIENPERPGESEVAFVSRDNRRNRSNIEKSYLAAMRQAKKRIWIANAYFFPGYRFMRAIRQARKRGVEVNLILQGDPDIPFALTLARTLYEVLVRSGVNVYEYRDRPLHAKIALVDDEWSTIGSSNLDPLSLAFNLEANVVVKDKDFNSQIAQKIEALVEDSVLIEDSWIKRRAWYLVIKDFFMYHALRYFPRLNGLFPAHTPTIRELKREWQTDPGKTENDDLSKRYPESRGARRVRKTDYHSAEV
ncbi:cardiolipin synthase ClsB [Gilvimarinus xylanilyticus]|uniref:Cardiolipin synthase B n=1 Tax=Gilvimarinus xylanilyticus TaxID=2944139 RepID=A0A9X2I592_9GAMM|nr:cardiolipin synthase ClsB [Gilvimarinus xylanilyticus]MCP8899692.1 cardiolipin synthase ClsB [Gilvimarinus xylanilyticus]